jgi:hypothetical protein
MWVVRLLCGSGDAKGGRKASAGRGDRLRSERQRTPPAAGTSDRGIAVRLCDAEFGPDWLQLPAH